MSREAWCSKPGCDRLAVQGERFCDPCLEAEEERVAKLRASHGKPYKRSLRKQPSDVAPMPTLRTSTLTRVVEAGVEAGMSDLTLVAAMELFSQAYLDGALRAADGNVSTAAQRAGIHRNSFHRKRSA